ncbi:MAG: PAS domain S-box protein [Geobacter sp.]|nr:PAS domain S-box protein [Geobacter sp.]
MTRDAHDQWLHATIIRHCPDAILYTDREGIIRLWNEGAERIFRIPSDEALGKPLDLIIPENLRKRHWDGYRQVMESGVTRYQTGLLSVPALRGDGVRISTEFSILMVRDDAGTPVGCAAVLRDVSDRWKREQDLKNRLIAMETARYGDSGD